jgi:hypothetical protein
MDIDDKLRFSEELNGSNDQIHEEDVSFPTGNAHRFFHQALNDGTPRSRKNNLDLQISDDCSLEQSPDEQEREREERMRAFDCLFGSDSVEMPQVAIASNVKAPDLEKRILNESPTRSNVSLQDAPPPCGPFFGSARSGKKADRKVRMNAGTTDETAFKE